MTKLKIIVTAVIVFSIVAGAFSFKIKAGMFCVGSTASGNNCTTYIKAKITTTGPDFKYYPTWDGTPAECTSPNNGRCTATVKLTIN